MSREKPEPLRPRSRPRQPGLGAATLAACGALAGIVGAMTLRGGEAWPAAAAGAGAAVALALAAWPARLLARGRGAQTATEDGDAGDRA